MGHEFNATDTMFSVRKVPWYGLVDGVNILDEYKSREELQPLVLGWEPVVEPVYRRIPFITPEGELGERYEKIEGEQLGSRSDNGAKLSVTPTTYEYVNNGVLFDLAEAVEGLAPDSVKLETGGSLRDGKQVWLLVRMDEPLVIKGDRSLTYPYLCFQNAHDRRGAFRAQNTLVRVECANTSHAADLDSQSRDTELVFTHTKSIHERIEQAKVALANWREGVNRFKEQMELLAMTDVTPKQVEWFIEKMIPMPTSGLVTERVANNVTEARAMLFGTLNSSTNIGNERTALGLYNSAVEHHDYNVRANSAETRFMRNFIRANKGGVKALAYKRALVAATV